MNCDSAGSRPKPKEGAPFVFTALPSFLMIFVFVSSTTMPVAASTFGSARICSSSVASISGVFGSPNHSAYGAAKAGIIHLTKTLALEGGRYGIRANAVSPGSIATPATMTGGGMQGEQSAFIGRTTPLQRTGVPEDIARAVLFFASPMTEFVTGQMILVDGGDNMH